MNVKSFGCISCISSASIGTGWYIICISIQSHQIMPTQNYVKALSWHRQAVPESRFAQRSLTQTPEATAAHNPILRLKSDVSCIKKFEARGALHFNYFSKCTYVHHSQIIASWYDVMQYPNSISHAPK